jgi:hypothetical protein
MILLLTVDKFSLDELLYVYIALISIWPLSFQDFFYLVAVARKSG